MEACYINTAHPDFLNGHQAIAIVNEQLHPKPQPGQEPAKQTKQPLANLKTNNSSSTSIDSNTEQGGSFFGSFFAGPKKTKKVNGLMEAASRHIIYRFSVSSTNNRITFTAASEPQSNGCIV